MSDISAKISQSGLLKGSSSSQQEVVASKVEVNTAGINLGDLSDVVITSPTDGSYIVYQSSSNTFLDDQTITKTATGINLTGDLDMQDSKKILLGNDDDLQIYHDSSNSYIAELGTGNLIIRADQFDVKTADASAYKIRAITGGATTLFHNGNTKIATTATGADITGKLEIDGGTGVVTTGTLMVRQSGNTGNDGISITSANATSHRIWKDANGNLNIGASSNLTAFVQELDGDIGIGTASGVTANGSKRTVHINSDTNGSAIRLSQGSNSSLIRYDDTNGMLVGTIANKTLKLETGDTTAITIDTSQNVGIGISDPSRKLQVSTAGTGIIGTFGRVDSASAYITFTDNTTSSDSHVGLGATANDFFVRAGNVERMRIDSSGNVGIGTIDPECKLHVKDTTNVPVKIETTHGSGNARLLFKPGSNNGWNIGANDNGHFTIYDIVGGKNSIVVESGADINTLYVDAGSQVGIGTNDPQRKLHVKGSGNTVAVKVEATDTSQASLDMQNSAGWFRFITNDGALRIYDQGNNAERWRISNSGNVGIGIPNPSAKLDVKGTGGSTSGFSIRNSHDNVRGYFGSDNDNADFLFTYVGTNSAEVKLKQNGNVILCESAGNVGINKSGPQTALDVAGTVTATTFSGDLNGTINTATTATTQSASNNSTKVATTAYVTTAVAAGVSNLVGGAGSALDTLNELAAALGNDANFATTTSTALTNRLRVDVNNQSLNATQKTNALTNLGVSAFGASLIDDADAAASRTTLGLGTAATTAATAYATAAQGSLAASALQSGDVLSTLTVTGPLVQNQILGNIFEVIAPDTGDAVDPIISLHRNSASPAVNDKLGIIKFNGEDSAGNKTEYASIQANITSPTSDAEYGSLAFNIMNNGTSEEPVMTLFESGLRLANDNDLLLSANGNIQFTGDSGLSTITTLYCVTPTSNRSINLPDASGTVITSGNTSDLGTLTSLTVDDIVINGTTIGHTSDTDILTFANAEPRLTVNASAMEIVDTNAGDNPGPTLSLYRNSSSPANSDELGRILFLGQNDAGEKTYYAQIATEISGSGVDDGGEAASIRFYVTDGGSSTDNSVTDLTEDQFDIGPSDTGVLTLTSGGATIGGSVGLMLGSSGQGIRFEGSNLGEGDSAYENLLRQQEPTQASVNSGDNHSYQMLPRGSGVLLRSRGSSQIDDANVDKNADTVTFSSAHGLRTGDQVVYNDAYSTSLEISNVDADCQTFFAIVTSTTAIKLASTLANALAGTALNIDDDGGDNQSFLFPHQMDNPIQMRDQVFELGHKTTAERDALTAETAFNGAILYNDTTNQVNAYVNSAWKAVATTNAESFTGGMTVTGGLQASQKCIFHAATTLTISKTTHPGTKIVYTSDSANSTFTFPAIVTADIGDTYTIMNASNKTITLDHAGGTADKFKKFVLGNNLITSTTLTIPKAGVVEVVVMDKGGECYVVFGSGIVS